MGGVWQRSLVACAVAGALTISIVAGCSQEAEAPQSNCSAVYTMFARGSGQEQSAQEATQFAERISEAVRSLGPVEFAELDYPASRIDRSVNPSLDTFIDAGAANRYQRSVREGVAQLSRDLSDLHDTCPASAVIVGGYSQGAQVVGTAIQELADVSPEVLGGVEAVLLFGDPLLHLPEGEPDADGSVAACLGRDYSPWRKSTLNCATATGLLGARRNYVPEPMLGRMWSWCNAGDVVCGGSQSLRDWDAHFRYAAPGGPIDEAARLVGVDVAGVAETVDDLAVLFDVNTLSAEPGTTIRFAPATNKLVPAGTTWTVDFDEDGKPDVTSPDPVVERAFPPGFSHVVTMTATPPGGQPAVGVVKLTVPEPAGKARPAKPANLVLGAERDNQNEALLTWSPSESRSVGWVVWVNGYPAGLIVGSGGKAIVEGLDRQQENELAVTAIRLDGVFGPAATVKVASLAGE